MGNHEQLMEAHPDGVYAEFCRKQEGQGNSPSKTSPTKLQEEDFEGSEFKKTE